MILAIDTATRTASIALYDETGVMSEATWRARENHTIGLMPQLLRLLDVSGVCIDEVEAIAVAIGPGSFTGLRIGLSLAKGIALARELPIVAVPTLDGLAQAFAHQPLAIWAVLDAGRGKYTAGRYEVSLDHAIRVGDYVVGDAEYVTSAISGQTFREEAEPEVREKTSKPKIGRVLVCGELDAKLRSTLLARLPSRIVLTGASNSIRRAAHLAELAWQRWQTNRVNDFDTLAPYYIPTASLPQATGHD